MGHVAHPLALAFLAARFSPQKSFPVFEANFAHLLKMALMIAATE